MFEGGLKSGTQGSIDSNIGTSKIKDALYDQVNIDAPRSRLIINPDYVSSLDDSDGTKQFDEWEKMNSNFSLQIEISIFHFKSYSFTFMYGENIFS